VAYRKLVTRYRRALDTVEPLDEPTQPPGKFGVLRTYSDRRHGLLFDPREPQEAKGTEEVDRYFGGYVPEILGPAKARRAGKDLYVEVRMGRAAAQAGGVFPIHIPVVKVCPLCCPGEESTMLQCHLCGGAGRITEDRMIEVTVPPGVRHGHLARIAMEDVGLGQTDLVVAVVVS